MSKTVYVEGNRRTFKAGADLSAKQFYIVKLDTTDEQVVLASAATDQLFGVLMNAPKSADVADVYLRNAAGTCKVVAGGSISIGDKLTANASGKAVTTTTSGDQILGVALHAATSGEIVEFAPAGFAAVH